MSKLGVVARIPETKEVEAEWSQVPGQRWLHSESTSQQKEKKKSFLEDLGWLLTDYVWGLTWQEKFSYPRGLSASHN
jgi:hypothetical protein